MTSVIVAVLGSVAAVAFPVQAQYSPTVVTGNPLPVPVLPSLDSPLPLSVTSFNPAAELGNVYVVYVSGGDEATLAQVRQVEPGAFRRLRNGQSVIQAGAFVGQGNAMQRASQLQVLGLSAQVELIAGWQTAGGGSVASFGGEQPGLSAPPVAFSTSPGMVDAAQSITFTAPSTPATGVAIATSVIPSQVYSSSSAVQTQVNPVTSQPNFSGYYFVVIPGQGEQLSTIGDRLQQLGAQPGTFFSRTQPIGPHIAMGPFPNRGAAEEWNRYLRGYGLDARVYYER
ncbi:MAG: hypothetical protein NZ772_16645 [Cyanobacteria bacterium]|nr:hypothetical protein [Cyanobacteriota bacterium]MDW8202962.1 hypothetical protein [Cyanobacteriota bacterium SKYGB_h_bin112]